MVRFQVPEGPFTIDKVMAAIREQVIDPAVETADGAPQDGHATGPASVPAQPLAQTDDGSPFSSLQNHLDLLAQRRSTLPPYRIKSHRPILGLLINPIKRFIHWGSRPYADAIREHQEQFNEATLQAVRDLLDNARRQELEMERQSENAARQRSELEDQAAELQRQASEQERQRRRYDLVRVFGDLSAEERLEALDVTRGTYEEIQGRQWKYVDYFRKVPGQVLDLGCGRGELIYLLRHQGIECWGADIDPLMVELCRKQGNHAVQADALEALGSVPAASLGGIFAAQVVEHLFPGELLEFLRLSRRQLAPGGVFILETLNPASLGVLAKSYYRDLDHKQPIHPEHLKLLVETLGFEQVELRYFAPFRDEERLPELPPAEALGLSAAAHQALQDRFERLDALLYGCQDYCVIARQGKAPPPGADAASSAAKSNPAGDADSDLKSP